MLNFVVKAEVLQPLVPAGTELDFHEGRTFLSVVGFLFLNTRVLGLPVPLHRDFEEVNLRFYVRRRAEEGWRRGVTFVRELVPRRAIALVARTFYSEPYAALPMRHAVRQEESELSVAYEWRRAGHWERLAMSATGRPQDSAADSHEEFITEHYWGYTARGALSSEYEVEHPRWRFWPATIWEFQADIASLYGQQFAPALQASPVSAFVAEGSLVQVNRWSANSIRRELSPD